MGTAKLTLTFDAWKDGHVAAAEYEATVARPKSDIKLEPVSPRLRATLQHPTRRGLLGGIRYSPNGSKLIAASYPDGVVQLWDSASGRELTRIETPPGNPGSLDYVQLTPDWSTAFVAIGGSDYQRIERDGKPVFRWTMRGEVRSWNLTTGRPGITLRTDPPSEPVRVTVSPDGRWLMSGERLSGEEKDRHGASLWEIATGRRRPLLDTLNSDCVFTPDAKAFAATRHDGEDSSPFIAIIDAATASARTTIPTGVRFGYVDLIAFSPDGRRLLGTAQEYPGKGDYSTWTNLLTAWDVATGRTLATFAAEEPKTWLTNPTPSPDGRTVVAGNGRPSRAGKAPVAKLYLLDAETLVPRKTIEVGPSIFLRATAFRPDGRIAAVVAQPQADDPKQRNGSPEDRPQSRVLLIDAATGAVRATLVLPQCFCASLAFSPDGKTLAAGGYGQVLLFDVGDL